MSGKDGVKSIQCTRKHRRYTKQGYIDMSCIDAYQDLMSMKKGFGKHIPSCLQYDIDNFVTCKNCECILLERCITTKD